jgi:hypothetical protein
VTDEPARVMAAAPESVLIRVPCMLEPGLITIPGRLVMTVAVGATRGLTKVMLPPVPSKLRVPAKKLDGKMTSLMPMLITVVTPAEGPSVQIQQDSDQTANEQHYRARRHSLMIAVLSSTGYVTVQPSRATAPVPDTVKPEVRVRPLPKARIDPAFTVIEESDVKDGLKGLPTNVRVRLAATASAVIVYDVVGRLMMPECCTEVHELNTV